MYLEYAFLKKKHCLKAEIDFNTERKKYNLTTPSIFDFGIHFHPIDNCKTV